LEENGANALLENQFKVNAIDIAFNEGVKEAKSFFASFPKYQKYMKENGYLK